MTRKRDKLAADLAAFVQRYREHNDSFERSLEARHARWRERGLLVPRVGLRR